MACEHCGLNYPLKEYKGKRLCVNCINQKEIYRKRKLAALKKKKEETK